MILVTGATGLTGTFVVRELLRRGHRVRVLARTDANHPDPAVEVVRGDLGDPASLVRAAEGSQGIVHAACTLTDSPTDIAGMRALLKSWTAGPFVFISTLDVYGLAGPHVVTEDTPLSEDYNDYARGKVVCERLLAEAAQGAGRSDFVSLRAPYIWGPHATARKRLVVPRLEDHQPLVLPGMDRSEWSLYQDAWVDARDMATIVAECILRPCGGPLNVVTGHFAWHDLYAELIRATGSRSAIVHKPIEVITDEELPRKHLYAQRWRFSEARLSQRLGNIPRLPFDVTIRDTVGFAP